MTPNTMPLFVNARFLTQTVTGVQRYGIEVSRELKRLRPEVRFLAPKNVLHHGLAEELGAEVKGRLTGHAWEQVELPRLTRGGALLSLCNTGPLLKREQVVTFHDANVFAVPEAYSLAFQGLYRLLFFGLKHTAKGLVTVSEFSRRELGRYCGIPESRLEVIPEGKEHVFAAEADEGILIKHALTGRPFLLAVSSQSPHKNFGAVVKALQILGETDFGVVIAGGTNPRVHARTGALPGSVKHVGYVSDGELRALYEHAAGFVHPAYYEGFGIPPLEAMALGCPVVVSKAASLPEVCGNAALYFDPHNPADIADKIQRLMGDDALRRTLRCKGLERAERFSWTTCAAEVLAFAESKLGR